METKQLKIKRLRRRECHLAVGMLTAVVLTAASPAIMILWTGWWGAPIPVILAYLFSVFGDKYHDTVLAIQDAERELWWSNGMKL